MSNTGQANFSGAKAFNNEGQKSTLGAILPIGFLAIGAGSMGLAVMTALSPPSVAILGKVAKTLDQVGLDKGPLLMFGILSTAMGFALSRLEKAGNGGDAALSAAGFAQSNAGSIELQAEILGSVQSELGQIRHEIATGRHEASEARQQSKESNGEASDPLFRLAASLDQLGAQIDKRIDKARREMMDAISSVASVAEVSAQQREESFTVMVKDVDSVRMDIADLRAQLTRVSGDVTSTKVAVSDLSTRLESTASETPSSAASVEEPAQEPAQQPVDQVVTTAPEASESTPSGPALPRELSEEAPAPEPAGPLPTPSPETKSEEPQYTGYQHEDEQAEQAEERTPEIEEPAKPALGVNMESLGFPEPPAPMPKPSEGLSLIDEMDEDTARRGDATPPLFPDV